MLSFNNKSYLFIKAGEGRYIERQISNWIICLIFRERNEYFNITVHKDVSSSMEYNFCIFLWLELWSLNYGWCQTIKIEFHSYARSRWYGSSNIVVCTFIVFWSNKMFRFEIWVNHRITITLNKYMIRYTKKIYSHTGIHIHLKTFLSTCI